MQTQTLLVVDLGSLISLFLGGAGEDMFKKFRWLLSFEFCVRFSVSKRCNDLLM